MPDDRAPVSLYEQDLDAWALSQAAPLRAAGQAAATGEEQKAELLRLHIVIPRQSDRKARRGRDRPATDPETCGMDGYPALGLIEKPASFRAVSRPSRQALLVLGMSRSGTSLLTQVLHALGAELPSDLMGPAHGNPFGHFEPSGLVALNDRILEALDRPWNDPRPIAPRWFRSRPAYAFLRRVVAQIGRSYGGASLLVLKDPRLCRLLPLYLDALDLLDVEPLVVLQVRPMREVMHSLRDRDDMAPDLAEFLWLRSAVEAEWHSRSCRRVWVSMAEILADWPGTVRRIADGLRLDWPEVDLSEVESRIRPRLRHHVAAAGEAANSRTLSAIAWMAIERGLAGDEGAARAGFDAVRTTLQDLDRMYAPILPEEAGKPLRTLQRLLAPLRSLRRHARDALAGSSARRSPARR